MLNWIKFFIITFFCIKIFTFSWNFLLNFMCKLMIIFYFPKLYHTERNNFLYDFRSFADDEWFSIWNEIYSFYVLFLWSRFNLLVICSNKRLEVNDLRLKSWNENDDTEVDYWASCYLFRLFISGFVEHNGQTKM